MNKKKSFKIFCLTCAGMLMLALPVKAMWPTLDLSQVTNMINGWTSQIESTSSTIQSTVSVGNIQQQIGDSVGGLSKFTDVKEKAEKEKEKLEKQTKRAEKLAELKKKFEEQAENAEQFANNVKSEAGEVMDAGESLYNEGMDIYDEGKSVYDEGMDIYDEGMDMYDEGMDTIESLQDAVSDDESASETGGNNAMTGKNEEQFTEEEIMDGETLDDEAIADLISDEEFSEGSWNGESGNLESSARVSESGDDAALPTTQDEAFAAGEEVSVGRQPFTNKTSESEKEEQISVTAAGNVLSGAEGVSNKVNAESVNTVLSEGINKVSEKASTVEKADDSDNTVNSQGSSAAAMSSAKQPTRRAFTTQSTPTESASAETMTGAAATVKTAGQSEADSFSASGTTELKSGSVSAETSAKPASEAAAMPARRAFTTSSTDFLYQSSRPMAFAQTASPTFKTGTNDDGKFIYSDIIANKCGINFDEVEEEKVIECVKTWVLGMNDANAETAADWKKEYNKAKRDHVAADLAMALTQKNYSASFDTEVADDLDSKSEALTNEREEISFVGKVAQTNQEVIIRLMEAMTGQAVTEAWSAIEIMDKDYYDEEEIDE